MKRATCVWAMAAFLGIAVTAALTWSVSQVAGQRIGLSSQHLSATEGLAPRRPASRSYRRPAKHVERHSATRSATIATQPPPPVTGTAPVAAPPAPAPASAITGGQRDDSSGGSSVSGSGTSRSYRDD